MKKQFLITGAVIALLAACSPANETANTQSGDETAEAANTAPELGSFGIDTAAMNAEVKPGDDFFRYVNGTWLDTFEIPEDRTRYGSFSVLTDRSEKQVKGIIEDAAAKSAAPGSAEQKVGDLFASYMDADAIEAKGLTPLQGDFDKINAMKTHEDVAVLMMAPDMQAGGIFGGFVNIDSKQPDQYAFYMGHAGLGLPDRDYYLKDDQRFKDIRVAYVKHIANMLDLAGVEGASDKADAIMALETRLANDHWARKDRRNRDLTYNKMTMDELVSFAPGFPWRKAAEVAKLGDLSTLVVREKSAFPKLAKDFAETSVDDWKAYMTFKTLSNYSAQLPKAFDDENFAFYGTILRGQPKQRDRWKRGVRMVSGTLGEAIGQVYVKKYFPPESKAKMVELVENLRTALGEHIDNLEWMSPETKVEAHAKLAAFTPKIGYPDKWKDYSSMTIKRDDLIGNVRAGNMWAYNDNISKLGGPIDKGEWFMSPQTVNAYYSPPRNEIVFPAAILQAPFFDPNADMAVNYGGIGAVIGHEMGHGFDDQGRKSDGTGMLRNWWTDADVKAFEERSAKLGKQYDGFEPIEGHHVNGELTMGENIGDLGGINFALSAYKLSLKGKDAPVIDGFTGEQRLFLSWGQIWRGKMRDESLINQITTNPHSPSQYRANGIVRNVDAWYDAFDVKEGDAMYLPPEERVKIW
ncbi:MAG: peptidase M13 [Robiginitomaculum sp.]|nr:MAG: peptidase M13 [Robiginitomaculum sp.]